MDSAFAHRGQGMNGAPFNANKREEIFQYVQQRDTGGLTLIMPL
jgi:hypothetical protein